MPHGAVIMAKPGVNRCTPVSTGHVIPALSLFMTAQLLSAGADDFLKAGQCLDSDGDKGRFKYPGEGYTNLALSTDGGLTWVNNKIISNSGSCYSTIFEVEPDIIFMQSDQLYCRIKISRSK